MKIKINETGQYHEYGAWTDTLLDWVDELIRWDGAKFKKIYNEEEDED